MLTLCDCSTLRPRGDGVLEHTEQLGQRCPPPPQGQFGFCPLSAVYKVSLFMRLPPTLCFIHPTSFSFTYSVFLAHN